MDESKKEERMWERKTEDQSKPHLIIAKTGCHLWHTQTYTHSFSLSVVVLQFLLLQDPVFLSVSAAVNPGCCGLHVWLRVQADVLIWSEVLFFTTQQYDKPLSFSLSLSVTHSRQLWLVSQSPLWTHTFHPACFMSHAAMQWHWEQSHYLPPLTPSSVISLQHTFTPTLFTVYVCFNGII